MALGAPLNFPHMCIQVKRKEDLKKSLQKSKDTVKNMEILFKDTIKNVRREKERNVTPSNLVFGKGTVTKKGLLGY